MTRVLILGANGLLARNTTRVLLEKTDAALTLYLRRASRLANPHPARAKIVEGDVLDAATLRAAMQGPDAVPSGPCPQSPADWSYKLTFAPISASQTIIPCSKRLNLPRWSFESVSLAIG